MRNEKSGAVSSVVAFPPPAVPVLKSPMRVNVTGPAFEGRPDVQSYVELRLLSALGHLTRRVECVAVQGEILDVGPSRGAARCRIWARLLRGRQLRTEAVDADAYTAIDQATEALARDVDYVESRAARGETRRWA